MSKKNVEVPLLMTGKANPGKNLIHLHPEQTFQQTFSQQTVYLINSSIRLLPDR